MEIIPAFRGERGQGAQSEGLRVAACVDGCDRGRHVRGLELHLVYGNHQIRRRAGRRPGGMQANLLSDHEVIGACEVET